MKSNLKFLLLLLISLSISCSQNIKTTKEPPTVMDKYIIGYIFPQNKILNPDEIAFEKLTHINYAFADIRDGKIIEGFEFDAENFKILNGLKSKNPGLKILISVGGWTWSGNFSDMALTKANRQKFIDSSIEFIQRHQLDGIDLDWEYPGLPGMGNTHRKEDKKNFTRLLKQFRKSLDELGNADQKHYLLTIAAGAFEDYLNHTEMKKAQRYLDFVNIMTYDFTGAWNPKTGHHSNLYASSFDPEGNSCNKAVSMFMQRGVPAEKIVLGVPFYGRGWQEVNPQQNGLYQDARGLEGDFSYKSLVEKFINKSGFVRLWDESARSPFLWNGNDSKFITYDDPASLNEKCEYIKKNGLRGVLFWEYHADNNNELLNTLFQSLKEEGISSEL